MVMFWVIVALLLLGALLLLLPPLWAPRAVASGQSGGANLAVYRDQLKEAERDLASDAISPERFEQLKAEIERRVLEDTQAAAVPVSADVRPAKRTVAALALLIPAASVALYLTVGQPDAAAPGAAAPQAAAGGDGSRHDVSPDQILRMVTALAERLKAEPNNAEGWQMLGRTYAALERYPDAVAAFRKAAELLPKSPDVLADLADVLGMAQGRNLTGEPARVIQKVLDLDPKHTKGLALAGSVAFEQRDYVAARGYWQRLLAVLPPDSEMVKSIQGGIAEATQLAGDGGAAPAPAAQPAQTAQTAQAPRAGAPASAAAAGSARITGQVLLAPELKARLAAGDTLFIFARAANGPRLPLAIVRQAAGSFPVSFTLDDSQSMSPDFKLSGFAQVVVGARVSKSGNATPQSGDLIGQVGPVANTSQGLQITLGQVQP